MDFKYPYTDFHELNLDWFLARFKELVEEWNSVKEDWNSLHDYVQNYFDNLNVQTEIDNKINAMILDGSFATILTPLVEAALPTIVDGKLPAVVASQIGVVVAAQIGDVVAGQLPAVAASAAAAEVGAWLAAHIDPDTGYVIDKSLTVSDAAADAAITGKRIDALLAAKKTTSFTAAGQKWISFDIRPGHKIKVTNKGPYRLTAVQTTLATDYTYIERVDTNGFNSGEIIYFEPSQQANYFYIYAVGVTEVAVEDVTTIEYNGTSIDTNVDNIKANNSTIVETLTGMINSDEYININPIWEVGGINNTTGVEYETLYNIRTNFIKVKKSTKLIANATDPNNSATIFAYNLDGTLAWKGAISTNTEFGFASDLLVRFWVYGTIDHPASIANVDDYISIKVYNKIYEGIPDYYDSYMPAKLDEIRAASSYTRGITFPYITDVHLQNNTLNSGRLIKYIDDRTNAVPFVIFGGDVPKAIDTSANVIKYADQWNEYMSTFGKHKTVQVHGNHDYMCKLADDSLWFAPLSTVFQYIKQNDNVTINRPANALYGSVDIKPEKVKLIIADNYDAGYDFENDTWNGDALMSDDQLKWMADEILSSDGYHILFVSHVSTLSSLSVPAEALALKPFDDLIKAAANKTTYTVDGETFDFTAWTGVVIAELAGHIHKDGDDVDDGVLYIATTCDCYNDNDPDVTRTRGTTSEQAFDIVNIDAENRSITLVRIGGGSNRTFTY